MTGFMPLLLKFVIAQAAALFILPAAGVTGMTAFWLGVAMAVISYVLGDRLILPAMGNGIATVADAGLAFMIGWWGTAAYGFPGRWGTIITFVAVTAVAEFFFHRYLLSRRERAEAR